MRTLLNRDMVPLETGIGRLLEHFREQDRSA
jgi:hypothetical protein